MAKERLEIVTMTPEQRRDRLVELEGVVKLGKEVFLQVGRALEEIRDGELYRPDFADFGEYCEATFGFDRRRANRYVAWARADEALSPNGLQIENEAQAREIYPLLDRPEAAADVWRRVGEENGGAHPAQAIREAMREMGYVRAPKDMGADTAEEVLENYAEVEQGEHGEYIDPDIMRRTSHNRARRLHNEDDQRKRIDALPDVEETGIEGIEILQGEFQSVLEPRIATGSVDLVLTDPPYAADDGTHLLWDALGLFSKRVLKPDGFLVSYMGTDDTAEELERVRKSVPWWWQIIVTHESGSDPSHDRRFHRNYKPINVFGRVADRLKKRKMLVGLREGSGRDKTYHEWGQPVEEAIRLIEELTEPGELVVDPFVGGGTTAVAAMKTGRRCIAAEMDERHHRVAVDRVITESNTRGYGYEYDPEGDAARRAEPRPERVRRALTGLPPNVLVLRPRDISEAS